MKQGLVGFQCPQCGTVIYAVHTAECGHMCRKAKPRSTFVLFHLRGEVKES